MDLDIKPVGTLLAGGIAAPYPFVTVSGDGALAAVAEIRSSFQDASPVIWGSDQDASRLFELFDEDAEITAQGIIGSAQGRGAMELMDEHAANVRAQLMAWAEKRGKSVPPIEVVQAPRGSWPDTVRTLQTPASLFDPLTGRPKTEVLIGLVPTVRPWEIPAFHKFGSWNDCPAPQVHVAMAREWAERYGARLIVNSFDVIEFELEAPIGSREEALAVAEQQFRYCEDIVFQGSETLENLAASLIGARYWFFWWD